MQRIIVTLFISAALLLACSQSSKMQKGTSSGIPVLKVQNDSGKPEQLNIQQLLVNIAVTGNVATTTFDITFSNTHNRVLEGEFEFPLADGQNISRYALEIEGKMREGVVVEKQLARVAYENTIRQKIDPGLVEKTRGNSFRTRVYPIPANGTKRIIIGIEQELTVADTRLQYHLPLYLTETLQQFGVNASVLGNKEIPEVGEQQPGSFGFIKKSNSWEASYTASNVQPQTTIAFSIPLDEALGNLVTGTYNNQTVFHLCMPLPAEYKPAAQPQKIALLWDVSASAANRKHDAELALLTQYAATLQQQIITLVPFNISMLASESFSIRNGDAHALLERLQQLVADGGTQLGAIDLAQLDVDEILLFTDGLSTFGKANIKLSKTPVTVINSSPVADHTYLKYIAQQTNGRYIDLSSTTVDAAMNRMVQQPFHFIRAGFDEQAITELYPSTTATGAFAIAGILQKPTATITLHFGYGNTITVSKSYTIQAATDSNEMVKRIWANLKIAQLDLQYQQNKAMITALGKAFSIVTRNTSLLVLDRVEDYVQYGIVPPAELQKAYYSLLKLRTTEEVNSKSAAFEEALDAMNQMQQWWQTDFKPRPVYKATESQVLSDSIVSRINGNVGESYFATLDSAGGSYAFTNAEERQDQMAIHQVQFSAGDIKRDEEVVDNNTIAKLPQPSESIDLKEWKPDVPYLKKLEAAAPADYINLYLQLKPAYAQQPSFFADVARFFFQHQRQQQGLVVLSNICEMKLEDAELLRIVANQLLEVNETALAIETFSSIREIRGEQPQSYRDLALACQDAGDYQQAIALLYKVATDSWDNRFGQIKAIALNEMNAIISSHPNLDLTGIDKRLVRSMPVDARIVISWSSDNSDIDLWVTDPKKEKCYYSNQETNTGGRISNDVTQGYGPEEFMVKKAVNGAYKIELNLYGDTRQTLGGPITVKAALYTHFGKPNQKREIINCRLSSNKEVITLGVLNFKG